MLDYPVRSNPDRSRRPVGNDCFLSRIQADNGLAVAVKDAPGVRHIERCSHRPVILNIPMRAAMNRDGCEFHPQPSFRVACTGMVPANFSDTDFASFVLTKSAFILKFKS